MEQILDLAGTAGFFSFALGLNVFTVLWAIKKPWDSSEAGKYFWGVTVLLTLVIDLFVALDYINTPELVEAWIGAVLWPLMGAVTWRLVIEVIVARRREKRENSRE